MKRTDIIREGKKAEEAGKQFSKGECKFFRAIYETESINRDTPEGTIICSDYIDDAETFVAMMQEYGISRLISTDGWSGAMARGMELQKAGLKAQGFDYIEKTSDFFGGKKSGKIAGLVFTF